MLILSVKDRDLFGYSNQYVAECYITFDEIKRSDGVEQKHLSLNRPNTIGLFKSLNLSVTFTSRSIQFILYISQLFQIVIAFMHWNCVKVTNWLEISSKNSNRRYRPHSSQTLFENSHVRFETIFSKDRKAYHSDWIRHTADRDMVEPLL